ETKRQKDNLRCLGIRRMHQTVEGEQNPVTMGQLAKIAHLVKYEVID
ncbi:MAG: 50S ribosomal protein L30, partial [Bacteroidales bacterium]|nr:50S ribosomal protein L30 [Bacteroidales bacterium]